MSRQSKIRWKKSDNQELARAVKNFNAKIDRIAKKNPEMQNALPEKMSVKQLKQTAIRTRQDLKRELNALKRFSKRGAEEIITYGDYNIKLTKWQKTEINRRLPIINKRRAERLSFLEALDMTREGRSLGYTKGQVGMGKIEQQELRPMQGLTPGMNQRGLQLKFQAIMRESSGRHFREKDYRARENYIKCLRAEFKGNDVNEVIRKIERMDIDEFMNKFYSESDASFEGLYRGSEAEYGAYMDRLKSIWLDQGEEVIQFED